MKGRINECPDGGFIGNTTAASTLHPKAIELHTIQQTNVTSNEKKATLKTGHKQH